MTSLEMASSESSRKGAKGYGPLQLGLAVHKAKRYHFGLCPPLGGPSPYLNCGQSTALEMRHEVLYHLWIIIRFIITMFGRPTPS